jgi:hypothetical protein
MNLSFIRNNRFPIFFTLAMLALTFVSLWWDITHKNEVYWFQRAGALVVLAGANLQYAKVVDLWKRALEVESNLPSVEERIASGQGISMSATAKETSETHAFAIRIHGMVTEKSRKDVLAILFILFGTVIWAYGDLLFKCQ